MSIYKQDWSTCWLEVYRDFGVAVIWYRIWNLYVLQTLPLTNATSLHPGGMEASRIGGWLHFRVVLAACWLSHLCVRLHPCQIGNAWSTCECLNANFGISESSVQISAFFSRSVMCGVHVDVWMLMRWVISAVFLHFIPFTVKARFLKIAMGRF